MLRVDVIGDGPRSEVVRLFVALGASIAGEEPGPIETPGIEVYDSCSGSVLPRMHLLVGVHPDPDVAHGNPDADLTIGNSDLRRATATAWQSRIVPFEANVRTQRRAPRARQPILAGARSSWADDAARLIARLRTAVSDHALRIDHIGSTSVPGLPAKDLVDIQVTVKDLATAHAAARGSRDAGFVRVDGEWFGEDRSGTRHREAVAVDADPGRPVNINFRAVTAPVWRDALLFRDWLRANDDERDAYAAMKATLAVDGLHVDRYSENKMPWIRAALSRAEKWASTNSWTPQHP